MTPVSVRSLRGVAIAGLLGAAAASCGTSTAATSTTTTSTAATTTSTSATLPAPTTGATVPATAPTTAATIPVAPQPAAETAANALISSWASGDLTTALRVATSGAVSTLFAVHYPRGEANNRGCTSAFPPIVCTYGPPGGGPTNASIFQLYVSQGPGGWYVSSVVIES